MFPLGSDILKQWEDLYDELLSFLKKAYTEAFDVDESKENAGVLFTNYLFLVLPILLKVRSLQCFVAFSGPPRTNGNPFEIFNFQDLRNVINQTPDSKFASLYYDGAEGYSIHAGFHPSDGCTISKAPMKIFRPRLISIARNPLDATYRFIFFFRPRRSPIWWIDAHVMSRFAQFMLNLRGFDVRRLPRLRISEVSLYNSTRHQKFIDGLVRFSEGNTVLRRDLLFLTKLMPVELIYQPFISLANGHNFITGSLHHCDIPTIKLLSRCKFPDNKFYPAKHGGFLQNMRVDLDKDSKSTLLGTVIDHRSNRTEDIKLPLIKFLGLRKPVRDPERFPRLAKRVNAIGIILYNSSIPFGRKLSCIDLDNYKHFLKKIGTVLQSYGSKELQVCALNNNKVSNPIVDYKSIFSGLNIKIVNTRWGEFMSNMGLIVCTYPETNYFQSLSSGTPCVVVFSLDIYRLDSINDNVLRRAIDVNLVITSITVFEDFVKRCNEDFMGWYTSLEVQHARKSLLERYSGMGKARPIDAWHNFLKNA